MFKNNLLIVSLILLSSFNLNARNFWNDFGSQMPPIQGKQLLHPLKYKVFSLEQEGILQFLKNLADQPENSSSLILPSPDGSFMEFKIWKNSLMEKELQDKYPMIYTFTAVSEKNPNITAKIDFTPKGFHALIFDQDKTYLIDPFSDVSDGYYLVYYKSDYEKPLNQRMSCELDDQEELRPGNGNKEIIGRPLPALGLKQSGSLKKTYRLALSCTGEYAVAVAGSNPTTAAVLSAMVTTLNRINGIYERELSVTLSLIGNTDLLIYTDPNTDPFPGNANNNGSTLLNLNQTNTNAVIGTSNYDMGHIFSTGGGGIASLGSICSSSRKAKGVTGLPQPVGDIFDVDYVAHEMGHQFGANHIFNANTGSCNYNGVSYTAYEPGGGTTIMGYAGICGVSNNVQNYSDAYFHAISLDEISDFLTSTSWNGGGATCGTTEIGNVPPDLDSINQIYAIPYNTPFEIISPTVVEVVPGMTTYNWEQWNLGDFRSDESGSAAFLFGPNFRSFNPSQNQTRIFPRIDSLIRGNTDYKGERLSQVERDLEFKVTVRNIINGWGSFFISPENLTASVINTGTPFRVTSQNMDQITWISDSTETVTWDVAQTDLAPINVSHVDILLSTDGGYTYPINLAVNVPNNGSAQVVVPHINTDKARIKVKSVNNIFFNINTHDFKIDLASTAIKDLSDVDAQFSIFPNPAKDYLNIRSEDKTPFKLQLMNYLGQEVWKGEMRGESRIQLESFPRGVYLLILNRENDGKRLVKKISLK